MVVGGLGMAGRMALRRWQAPGRRLRRPDPMIVVDFVSHAIKGSADY
jgi:hypothetical protein